MQFSVELSVLIDVLIVETFHAQKVLEKSLKNVVFLVVGKFGKTIWFKTVPFRKVRHFMLHISQVSINLNQLIPNFLFGWRVILFFYLASEFDLRCFRVSRFNENILHIRVVYLFQHHPIVSYSADLFHGIVIVKSMEIK